MISVTGITGKYILQPELLEKHKEALDWLSASVLWKSEVTVFQKILDERAPLFNRTEDKKQIDHFQNLILYYKGEVIDSLRKKIHDHETRLARMLEAENESTPNITKSIKPSWMRPVRFQMCLSSSEMNSCSSWKTIKQNSN